MDLKGMEYVGMELINFAENTDQLRVFVGVVMNIQTPQEARNILGRVKLSM
jgi:hypothetical protein